MSNPHVHSGTLVASTVTTVDLDQPYAEITVVNRDAGGSTHAYEIWFTVDGTVPTVAGDNCYVVSGVAGASRTVQAPTSAGPTSATGATGSVVQLISSGTPEFEVDGHV